MEEALAFYTENPPRGEFVLVLDGADEEKLREERQDQWKEIPLTEHMQQYLDQGMDKKSAMKQVAKDRGISKRDVYKMLLDAEEK